MRRAPKLVNLAIAAVALALLVASGSSAATPELRLAAADGALSLSNSREGEAIFNAEEMRPGGEVRGSVVISNTGSAAGSLSVSPTGGGGLLSNALELVVVELAAAGNTVRYAGSPAAMPSVSLGQIAPGQQREFEFVAKLPATAGNAFQGARWSAGFTWTAQATTRAPESTPERTPEPTPEATPVPTTEPTPVPTPRPGPKPTTPPAQPQSPGAGVPPAAGATLGDQVFGMPASTRCVNRYRFRIRVRRPKGVAFKNVKVTVNRRVKMRLAGSRARKLKSFVKLRRLPKGRVVVKVVAVTERGTKLTTKRTYRTCSVKKRAKKPRR